MRARMRPISKASAAAMEIAHHVDHRRQMIVNIVRDLPCRAAVWIAGKRPVEIAIVKRTRPRSSNRSRRVQGGDDNQPAANIRSLQSLYQPGQDNLTFIFIAMVSGREKDAGSVAIVKHCYRNQNHAIRAARDGMRRPQPADLLPRGGEIDGCSDLGHGKTSLFPVAGAIKRLRLVARHRATNVRQSQRRGRRSACRPPAYRRCCRETRSAHA